MREKNRNKKIIFVLLKKLINKKVSIIKGTVTQNIFSLKSGPKGCKGL